MNFKDYFDAAWSEHFANPKKVADEFKAHFSLLETEEDINAMANFIVHVCGKHLGLWTLGTDLLRKLKHNSILKDKSDLKRAMGVMTLGNNPNTSIGEFSPSDQARIYTTTSVALRHLGGVKAADKFLKLAEEILSHQLSKDDPAVAEFEKARTASK